MLKHFKVGSKVLVVNFLTGIVLAIPNILLWFLMAFIDLKNAVYGITIMISLLIIMLGLTVLVWGFIAEKIWGWK